MASTSQGSIPDGAMRFSRLKNAQTGSVAHAMPHVLRTGGFFPREYVISYLRLVLSTGGFFPREYVISYLRLVLSTGGFFPREYVNPLNPELNPICFCWHY